MEGQSLLILNALLKAPLNTVSMLMIVKREDSLLLVYAQIFGKMGEKGRGSNRAIYIDE